MATRIYCRVIQEDAQSWQFAPAARLERSPPLLAARRVNRNRYGLRRRWAYGLDVLLIPAGEVNPFTEQWDGEESGDCEESQAEAVACA